MQADYQVMTHTATQLPLQTFPQELTFQFPVLPIEIQVLSVLHLIKYQTIHSVLLIFVNSSLFSPFQERFKTLWEQLVRELGDDYTTKIIEGECSVYNEFARIEKELFVIK